jgi:hypothetical protein
MDQEWDLALLSECYNMLYIDYSTVLEWVKRSNKVLVFFFSCLARTYEAPLICFMIRIMDL